MLPRYNRDVVRLGLLAVVALGTAVAVARVTASWLNGGDISYKPIDHCIRNWWP